MKLGEKVALCLSSGRRMHLLTSFSHNLGPSFRASLYLTLHFLYNSDSNHSYVLKQIISLWILTWSTSMGTIELSTPNLAPRSSSSLSSTSGAILSGGMGGTATSDVESSSRSAGSDLICNGEPSYRATTLALIHQRIRELVQ